MVKLSAIFLLQAYTVKILSEGLKLINYRHLDVICDWSV